MIQLNENKYPCERQKIRHAICNEITCSTGLKGVRLLTPAGAGLNAHHTCIWIATTAVFGILAPGLQPPEELKFKLLFK